MRDAKKTNHAVAMTTNVMKKLSKDERKTIQSKPLFCIDIKSEEGNRGIFGIKHVANFQMKIEISKDFPHCIKCQQFGYTKNFWKLLNV